MGVICISAFMIPFCELFKFFSSVYWVDSFFANPLPNQTCLPWITFQYTYTSLQSSCSTPVDVMTRTVHQTMPKP